MPYEILDQGDCLLIRCLGVFDDGDLDAILVKAAAIDQATRVAPHRIVDFTSAESIGISQSSVFEVAKRWRGRAHPNPMKHAIIAHASADVGVARMFQTLIDSPDNEIRIVKSLQEATDWFAGKPVVVARPTPPAIRPASRSSAAGAG